MLLNVSSQTGDARKREEMQELPRHAHQAGVPQLPLPRHLQECEGPGAGPARKLLRFFRFHAKISNRVLLESNSLYVFVQDAKIEPEEFTTRLQAELKSSPQPYLIPFLKVQLIQHRYCYYYYYWNC